MDSLETTQEIVDTETEVKQNAKLLSEWIKKSKHFCVFTGAGISTSAGIPDYRGPQGTWTLKEQGVLRREGKVIDANKAIPTIAHMSLVKLMEAGFLKHIISQNCDGLHRRSGIPPQNVSF
eukprot:TRINITY_DN13179_c0_g1_i1.p1 TRINITY_DN13179_c0_g1~~TRINITY_DN13179_c0_g1_i1.p1  ORF type:complete len:121 (+),score=17.80 TRINITY_DN13179_c0_g1_i1:69-431(+)